MCKGTRTVWLEGSVHGEDECPNCKEWYVSPEIQAKMPIKSKTFIQKNMFEIAWEEFKKSFCLK